MNITLTLFIAAQAEVTRATAYRMALESEDPIFHSYLYDWFISNGRTDLLLEVRRLASV
jgi:nuclear pore complex protein Nup155